MTVEQDEKFKALAHGLLLGCAIPIVGYNVAAGKTVNRRNLVIYGLFIGFEVWNVVKHLQNAKGRNTCQDF